MRARLHDAARHHDGVRVTRAIPGADVIEGYVLAVGGKWVLLARVPQTRLDGYVAIRLRDVARVQPLASHAFYRALAEASDAWPPTAPATPIDLESTKDLIRTAQVAGTIVNLQVEYDDPEVAFLGAPAEVDARSVTLREVTPQAAWDGTVSRWPYRDISRVEFLSSYETDLLLIAGPPPAAS